MSASQLNANPETSRDEDTVSLRQRLSIKSLKRVRDTWGTNMEYVISTIASAVGLGNLYRFPYICQQNGGGAFIIPYLFTSILVGFPYLLMECFMGQYFQASILTIWRICPLMKGVGILNFLVVFWTSTYYIVILAWVNYYFFASISVGELPWETCNHTWNTQHCVSILKEKDYNETSSSVFEFFNNGVLMKSDYIFDVGQPQWLLLLVLASLWIFTFFTLFRGIKSMGRIVTIMMIIPVFTIIILLIRSIILPGAFDGISFLFKPDFEKILKPQVWYQAASQVFFSYSVGFGAIITYNSYNDYHINIWRASIIVASCDTSLCLICAVMVYSVLGFTSQALKKPLETLARKGPALVFLAYPTALSLLPAAPLWAIFFFLGALVLGLTSLIGLVQALICALEDENDVYVKYRWLITLVLCLVMFLIGVLMTTRSGSYFIDFMDAYGGAGWAVLSLVLLEGILMSYVYGARKMWENLNDMVGYKVPVIMKYLWLFVSPAILIAILIFSFVNLDFLAHQPGFVWWIDYFGMLFSFSSIVWVPLYMFYSLLRERGSCKERFKKCTTPQIDRIRRRSRSVKESEALAQLGSLADNAVD